MSRCFPYPPPGYTLSRYVEAALIESIKLHKERSKAKVQKEERKKEKQEKKEKKEKRREHKKKRKENQEKVKLSVDQNDPFKEGHRVENIWASADQLEKSSLTEEHDQPICLRSISSESSEDSNKRKRPLPTDNNRGHGKIIRIKLPSRKQDIPNVKQDVPHVSSNCCVPSGRTDIPVQTKDETSFRNRLGTSFSPSVATSGFGEAIANRADNELACSTSGNNGLVISGRFGVPCPEGSLITSFQNQELQYRNLMDNLLPQFLDSCLIPDDNDWLLCSENQGGRNTKRQKYDRDVMSCLSRSSLAPPRACYIPQVDIYALPYTIPF